MTRPQNPETAKDEDEHSPDPARWVDRFCPYCGGHHLARVRPAMQFYPADEQKETALRLVCLAARGLWHEMLNVMHQAVPRGQLVTSTGKPIDVKQLARMVGEREATVERYLAELEEHAVFSRTEEGIIYSRRMVRDEHLLNARASGGYKSLENENVPRPKSARMGREDRGQGYPSPGSSGPSPSSAAAVAVPGTSNSGKAESAAPPAIPPAFAEFTANTLRFCLVFYAETSPKRQADVAEQLRAVLTSAGAKLSKTEIVRNQSADRLDAKCREVLERGVGDADKAIVVLLKKLGDTSDDSAPGTVAERAAAVDRRREETAGRSVYAQARAYIAARPELEAQINRELNEAGAGAIGRDEAFQALALREFQKSRRPEARAS